MSISSLSGSSAVPQTHYLGRTAANGMPMATLDPIKVSVADQERIRPKGPAIDLTTFSLLGLDPNKTGGNTDIKA
uniref:Uncharacterized protein n=1 Tax=Caulobacter sp. (strain K31) TaxID=366602 RepID=B0T940_CAUSK